MTTTEWVERYNEAFVRAGLFLDPETEWRGHASIQRSFSRGRVIRWTDHPYPVLPNPSPFEPKEVVDDGQEGTGALNQKERLVLTAPEDGYYYINGLKTYCRKGETVRRGEGNVPDPFMSTDEEIKAMVLMTI